MPFQPNSTLEFSQTSLHLPAADEGHLGSLIAVRFDTASGEVTLPVYPNGEDTINHNTLPFVMDVLGQSIVLTVGEVGNWWVLSEFYSDGNEFPHPPCFAAGTMISTPLGQRPIEHIHVGDAVLTYDVARDRILVGRVLKVTVHPKESVGSIMVGGLRLRSTPNHPFFKVSGEALEIARADKLSHEDQVMAISPDRQQLVATQVTDTYFAKMSSEPVYNFDVGTYHTYFANGILVHNQK